MTTRSGYRGGTNIVHFDAAAKVLGKFWAAASSVVVSGRLLSIMITRQDELFKAVLGKQMPTEAAKVGSTKCWRCGRPRDAAFPTFSRGVWRSFASDKTAEWCNTKLYSLKPSKFQDLGCELQQLVYPEQGQ